MPTMSTSQTLQGATAKVARYLESDLVYHQTEYIVLIWAELELPLEVLNKQLRALVGDVSERSDFWVDIEDVDWVALTRRYAEFFN